MTVRYVPRNERAIRDGGVFLDDGYVVNCPPTSPIEIVIRAMAFQGGGIVQLGPFDYTVRGTLNLVSTVTLQGVPGATRIKKITGDGPVVRVFGGARLKDCTLELNRTDGTTYTVDQDPTRPWENSVVHLCEPVFENKHLEMLSGAQDGWQGTVYGAATIDGCMINCRISNTRGIYVGLYGVEADSRDSGATLDAGYLNARITNNTIIPLGAAPLHSCIYFAAGTYCSVCIGNICRSGNQSGTTGKITSTSANRMVAIGRSSAGANSPREEANIASYSEY
jgi:hypothetical protein